MIFWDWFSYYYRSIWTNKWEFLTLLVESTNNLLLKTGVAKRRHPLAHFLATVRTLSYRGACDA